MVLHMRNIMSSALVCGTVFFSSCTNFQSQSDQQNTVTRQRVDKAIAKIYPALVRLNVVIDHPQRGRMTRAYGSGSGTLIDNDGHILSNHHVAGHGSNIIVRLSSGERLKGELIGTDALTDLCIVKVDLNKRKDKTPILIPKFGDSDKVKVGDPVLALGSPAGLTQSVTLGIASNIGMLIPQGSGLKLDGENVNDVVPWIGHDAIIFGGNSGGPLINLKGEIIGINEVGIGSLGGAIPGNMAETTARRLISEGHIERSWTGATLQALLRSQQTADGVLISHVAKNSPAEDAGLRSGDILTHFNNEAVVARSKEELPRVNRLIFGTQVGSQVAITFLRQGKEMQASLTTVKRELPLLFPSDNRDWGLLLSDYTKEMLLEKDRKNREGVAVRGVKPGAAADSAKPAIMKGDTIIALNGVKVTNLTHFQKLEKELRQKSDELIVNIERNKQNILSVVKPGFIELEPKPASAAKSYLGVNTQVLTRALVKLMKTPVSYGVRITAITAKSPAGEAGLKVGDIVYKVDDMKVNARKADDHEIFTSIIREYENNSEIELDIYRDGQKMKINAILKSSPKSEKEGDEYKELNFEFTTIFYKDGDKTNIAKVTKVETGGWGFLAGLKNNDQIISINGQNSQRLESLKEAFAQAQKNKDESLIFLVKRGSKTLFLEALIEWK